MQQFARATIAAPTPGRCAAELLDALPPIMRFVIREMRSHRGRHLSVPQFRTLATLEKFPAANLSTVADLLGASRPATSRVVSLLVAKGLVRRREHRRDRRHLELVVTRRGATVMAVAQRATRRLLARELAAFDARTRAKVLHAMKALNALFGRRLRRDGKDA